MLTIIWLIFTTGIGYAVGSYWFETHIVLCSIIGFIIGLLFRFGVGGGDAGGFDFGGGGGGSDGGGD